MIETKGVSFRAGDFAVSDVSLRVEDGQYFVLMGRTGSGKSLLMKCICGLIRPERGGIFIGGWEVTHMAPRLRRIGYVPQEGALFPHMDVARNITFAARAVGLGHRDALVRAEPIIEMLSLRALLGRSIDTLSGGEKQKVALARALVARPAVLILDEPVSSLDEPSRREVCAELRGVHAELKVATIHICHNLHEAEDLADRVGVMDAGRIAQVGTLQQLRDNPATQTVAALVAADNRP